MNTTHCHCCLTSDKSFKTHNVSVRRDDSMQNPSLPCCWSVVKHYRMVLLEGKHMPALVYAPMLRPARRCGLAGAASLVVAAAALARGRLREGETGRLHNCRWCLLLLLFLVLLLFVCVAVVAVVDALESHFTRQIRTLCYGKF